MNRDQLTRQLEFLFAPANEIGLSMYFILRSENGLIKKQADISIEVRATLRAQFLQYLRETFTENQALHFADITTADNRKNAAYYFDLDAIPPGLEVMGELLDDERAELFNFNIDHYEDIEGFVFLLGNEVEKIALYKKQYPINLLRRDSILRLIKVGTRLVEVTEDIINVNEKIDVMQIGSELVIVNMSTLEKFFGFDDVIRSTAMNNLSLIGSSNLLTDITTLEEMVEDLRFARKLMRVKADSVVLQLPFAKVSSFIKQHPKLKRRMRFNDDETRISLDTRTSKELFLKLLNDDFLKSDLTDFLYETEIKDRLSNVEVAD